MGVCVPVIDTGYIFTDINCIPFSICHFILIDLANKTVFKGSWSGEALGSESGLSLRKECGWGQRRLSWVLGGFQVAPGLLG